MRDAGLKLGLERGEGEGVGGQLAEGAGGIGGAAAGDSLGGGVKLGGLVAKLFCPGREAAGYCGDDAAG